MDILWLYQLKSQIKERSIIVAKMGGYKMDCHIVAEDKIDLRPKKRKSNVGLDKAMSFERYKCKRITTHEAFMSPSTIGAERPGGLMAGAKAINTLTFSLRPGCILRAANAWAVP